MRGGLLVPRKAARLLARLDDYPAAIYLLACLIKRPVAVRLFNFVLSSTPLPRQSVIFCPKCLDHFGLHHAIFKSIFGYDLTFEKYGHLQASGDCLSTIYH